MSRRACWQAVMLASLALCLAAQPAAELLERLGVRPAGPASAWLAGTLLTYAGALGVYLAGWRADAAGARERSP